MKTTRFPDFTRYQHGQNFIHVFKHSRHVVCYVKAACAWMQLPMTREEAAKGLRNLRKFRVS